MRDQEIIGLWEAYSQVYELDEAGTATGPRLTDAYDKPPYGDDLKSKPTKKGPKMKGVVRKEETDLYDIILSHLLDEGYAETQEAAEAIMVNMSEDWRESIVEATYKPSGSMRQNYRDYDKRDRGGSEEDHKKALEMQKLIRSVQGNSSKKSI